MTTSARREFIKLALSAIPASTVVTGCVNDSTFVDEPAVAPLLGDESERRMRWQQLHAHYIGSKNQHDLPAILQCFASGASVLLNEQEFCGSDAIASLLTTFGMSSAEAGLSGTQSVHDREFFGEQELIIHGRVLGLHVGRVLQFPATLQQVELHYAAIYRFDDLEKIVSERVAINLAPLAG